MYARRLTAIEALQQVQEGKGPWIKIVTNSSMQIWAKVELAHWIPCINAQNDEQLGRWLWLELEERIQALSGTSRMVHTVCDNCGWLSFPCYPLKTLLGIYYCSWMPCWLRSCYVVLSHGSRLEVCNNVVQETLLGKILLQLDALLTSLLSCRAFTRLKIGSLQ